MNEYLDKKDQVDVVYLDCKKAFDTVPHKRLLLKLEAYGISGKLLNWIKEFLSNRTQRVTIKGVMSDSLPVLSGVPQGSVLGPLLFLLYIMAQILIQRCFHVLMLKIMYSFFRAVCVVMLI